MPKTKSLTFDPEPISDEEYNKQLRLSMLDLIMRAENERTQFTEDSIDFQIRDFFLETALDVLESLRPNL